MPSLSSPLHGVHPPLQDDVFGTRYKAPEQRDKAE
jgi:hypothetical protein